MFVYYKYVHTNTYTCSHTHTDTRIQMPDFIMYVDAFIIARAILCILLYFLRESRILIPHFIYTRPIATTMYDIRVNKLLFRSIYLSRDLSVVFRIESPRVLYGKISIDLRGRSSSGNNIVIIIKFAIIFPL